MIEPGASLIPHNDPTLLWINAGVAALKKYFDGSEKPASNRIANAQKSIRTNDIENVGRTARHHTFFAAADEAAAKMYAAQGQLETEKCPPQRQEPCAGRALPWAAAAPRRSA